MSSHVSLVGFSSEEHWEKTVPAKILVNTTNANFYMPNQFPFVVSLIFIVDEDYLFTNFF